MFLYEMVFGKSIWDLSVTGGSYLNKDLPVSEDSHCLCHWERPILTAACLISVIVTTSVSLVIAAASQDASLASLSASSLPLILAWPGVQDISTLMSFFSNRLIFCLISATCKLHDRRPQPLSQISVFQCKANDELKIKLRERVGELKEETKVRYDNKCCSYD